MTLANVACMLAKWGKNVLIVDWDLEAPGLQHLFPKSRGLDLTSRAEGLVELLNELSPGTSDTRNHRAWRSRLIELQPHSDVLISPLTAGSRSETYFQNVRNFDVEAFYEKKNGGRILETLRSQWKDATILSSSTAGRASRISAAYAQFKCRISLRCFSLRLNKA